MAAEPRTDLKLVDENFTAPADAPAADKAKAVKAAAIREGIRRQKQRDASERKAEAAAHQANVEGVKSAHIDEMNRVAARERAVGHHRAAWLYGIPALILGGIAATVGMVYMQDYTADTLARNFREQAMTGAIIQANQEPARCIPGETLGDGRVCPRINPREPGDAPNSN